MSIDNLIDFAPYISSLLAGTIGWIGGSQKQKIDMVNSQRETIAQLTNDVKNLSMTISELMKKNYDLEAKVQKQDLEMSDLLLKLDKYENFKERN